MKKSGGGREERKLRRKKTTKIHLSLESEAQVGLEGPTEELGPALHQCPDPDMTQRVVLRPSSLSPSSPKPLLTSRAAPLSYIACILGFCVRFC